MFRRVAQRFVSQWTGKSQQFFTKPVSDKTEHSVDLEHATLVTYLKTKNIIRCWDEIIPGITALIIKLISIIPLTQITRDVIKFRYEKNVCMRRNWIWRFETDVYKQICTSSLIVCYGSFQVQHITHYINALWSNIKENMSIFFFHFGKWIWESVSKFSNFIR